MATQKSETYWKVTFSHVAKDGLLRSATMCILANDLKEANQRAMEIISQKYQMPRITKTVVY